MMASSPILQPKHKMQVTYLHALEKRQCPRLIFDSMQKGWLTEALGRSFPTGRSSETFGRAFPNRNHFLTSLLTNRSELKRSALQVHRQTAHIANPAAESLHALCHASKQWEQ